MVLCFLRFVFVILFAKDSGGGNLIDSDFTGCLVIKTLADWDHDSFSFRTYQFLFEELDDSANVLGSFLGDQLHENLYVLFFMFRF